MTTKVINFRENAGYVTDGTDETYNLGGALEVRGGLTMTWANNDGARDRDNALAVNLAGIVFVTNTAAHQGTFTTNLPDGAVEHEIRLAMGDGTSPQLAQYCQLLDNVTAFATVNDGVGTLAAHFLDATGVDRTAAAWPAGNVAVTHTFASSVLTAILGYQSIGNSSTIATLWFTATGGAPPTRVSSLLRMGI